MNAGCVSEFMNFKGHVSEWPHWLWTNTIICIWFPELGGGGFGAMVLVQESILYTPSLNQHSAPRSVHLETVMRCCTTDTLASSIRTQPKPEAPSRWRRDKQKHSNCLSQCTDHQASKGGNFISGDTNPKDNPSTPTPTQFFYVFQMEECVLVSIM